MLVNTYTILLERKPKFDISFKSNFRSFNRKIECLFIFRTIRSTFTRLENNWMDNFPTRLDQFNSSFNSSVVLKKSIQQKELNISNKNEQYTFCAKSVFEKSNYIFCINVLRLWIKRYWKIGRYCTHYSLKKWLNL